MLGAAWIGCAALCFFLKDKESEFLSMSKRRRWLGIYFAVFGVCGLAGQAFDNDVMVLAAFLLSIGFLCIWVYVYSIIQDKSCTYKIEAVYIDYNRYTSKGISCYSPVFDYDYEGVHYSRQTIESYSFKKLNKLFEQGRQYYIFINPSMPECCITTKKVSRKFIFCAILGVIFIAVFFYSFV